MRVAISAGLCPLLAALNSLRASETVSYPFYGVREIQRTDTSPRPLFINILDIDLTAGGIRFRASPGDANPPLYNGVPDETITQTTRQFVAEQGAQAGINASFFRLDNSSKAVWTNDNGIAASDGVGYSPWDGWSQRGFNISQDNVATIIGGTAALGYATSPSVSLYNAFQGKPVVWSNGVNIAPARNPSDSFTQLNPRTAIGVTANCHLLLATIDGRQTGFSEGMYLDELGPLLAGYGATDVLNLDGGGSTTMAIDYYNDSKAVLLANSPVGQGTKGSERYVGVNLALFAKAPPAAPTPLPSGSVSIDDFETGSGHFWASPATSTYNTGIGQTGTKSATSEGSARRGTWSQQIDINPAQDQIPGYRLQLLSGSGTPASNVQLGGAGYVGFFLKTTSHELSTTIALNDISGRGGGGMEQSVDREIIADGQWHLYQWNLADANQWDSFQGTGDGAIGAPASINSIFLYGVTDATATVWFDTLVYNPNGDLAALVPEPSLLTPAALLLVMRRHRRHGKAAASPNPELTDARFLTSVACERYHPTRAVRPSES